MVTFLLGLCLALLLGNARIKSSEPDKSSSDVLEAKQRLYAGFREPLLRTAREFPLEVTGVPRAGWVLIVSPRGTANIVREDGSFTTVTGTGSLLGQMDGNHAIGDAPKTRPFNFRLGDWEATTEDFMPAK